MAIKPPICASGESAYKYSSQAARLPDTRSCRGSFDSREPESLSGDECVHRASDCSAAAHDSESCPQVSRHLPPPHLRWSWWQRSRHPYSSEPPSCFCRVIGRLNGVFRLRPKGARRAGPRSLSAAKRPRRRFGCAAAGDRDRRTSRLTERPRRATWLYDQVLGSGPPGTTASIDISTFRRERLGGANTPKPGSEMTTGTWLSRVVRVTAAGVLAAGMATGQAAAPASEPVQKRASSPSLNSSDQDRRNDNQPSPPYR
jgi:hypothetical protein